MAVSKTVRLISLVGGESTGKSQLARSLADSLNGVIAGDQLRAFVAATGRTPRPHEQPMFMALQASAVNAAMVRAISLGKSWVIADPDPFMTAVYSLVYFDDASLIAQGLAALRQAEIVIWCGTELAWEADQGMRDGEWARAAADEAIAMALDGTDLPILRTGPERTTHPAWVPDLSAVLT